MENKSEMLQVPQRDIEVVTGEINELTRQAGQMMLVFAIEVGRRLTEAKSLLPHGEWGSWLKEKVHFSQSHANDLMKIFEEYGADQITIFGAVAKSQTIGNLPYTKALALLKIPSDEREEFIENTDVDGLSVRELQKVIKEREDAEAERDAAKKQAAELKGQLMNAENQLSELMAAADAKVKVFEEAADREEALRKQLQEAKAEAAKAASEAEGAREALEQLRANPEIPEEVLKKVAAEERKKLKEQAKAKADKLISEVEEKLSAAEAQRDAAKKEAEEARAEAERLEKQLKMADPTVAEFKVRFDTFYELLKKCAASLAKMRETDPETAEKLTKAMQAAVAQEIGGGAA